MTVEREGRVDASGKVFRKDFLRRCFVRLGGKLPPRSRETILEDQGHTHRNWRDSSVVVRRGQV